MQLVSAGRRVINLDQITWCELVGSVVYIYLAGGSAVLLEADEARAFRAALEAALDRREAGR